MYPVKAISLSETPLDRICLFKIRVFADKASQCKPKLAFSNLFHQHQYFPTFFSQVTFLSLKNVTAHHQLKMRTKSLFQQYKCYALAFFWPPLILGPPSGSGVQFTTFTVTLSTTFTVALLSSMPPSTPPAAASRNGFRPILPIASYGALQLNIKEP